MGMEEPEIMTGTSLDIAAEQRARLKELFPAVFTETKNDAGEIIESVDFEKLKADLGKFTDNDPRGDWMSDNRVIFAAHNMQKEKHNPIVFKTV